jgi:hypothetical protein
MPDNGKAADASPSHSMHEPDRALIYVEHIRLLTCEFEIRTNSPDVVNRLRHITQRAEQDVPVAHRSTVTIIWSGDEFRLSGSGIDDFELSATSALEALYQRLHHRAIAAMPDHCDGAGRLDSFRGE